MVERRGSRHPIVQYGRGAAVTPQARAKDDGHPIARRVVDGENAAAVAHGRIGARANNRRGRGHYDDHQQLQNFHHSLSLIARRGRR